MVRSDLVRLDRRAVAFGLAAAAVTNSLTGRAAFAADKIKPSVSSVLLVVDVQNCFLPGGSLAVKDGDQVIPVINKIAKGFDNVVLTQDWHTPRHISFASSHPGKKPFETIDLPYGKQILWPDHCVQGTAGAELAKDLDIPKAQLVVRKGYNKRRRLVFDLPRGRQENSTFLEADKKTQTGLTGYLKERGLTEVFISGLATDFCVAWSAVDARRAGFGVYVVEDACRGIEGRMQENPVGRFGGLSGFAAIAAVRADS